MGNIIGALCFAGLLYLAQSYSDNFTQNLITAVSNKMTATAPNQHPAFGQLLISGFLANWIVALVCFFAFHSRNTINQFILLLLAFTFLAASNLQYFPINLGYFSLATFFSHDISFGRALITNLLPVAIGNILGASILVAAPLKFLAKKY